jgi:hypothetical protein
VAALLMAATGVAFAALGSFWPLLVAAFAGPLNPSAGDVSMFLPLEQALLARGVSEAARTTMFARYSLTGVLTGAAGTLLAALPELAVGWGLPARSGFAAVFLVYAAVGVAVWLIYRRLPGLPPRPRAPAGAARAVATGRPPSGRPVQPRFVRGRPGRPVPAGALAVRCVRPVAGRGGPPVLLGRATGRPVPAGGTVASPPDRPDQHHGVHAPAGECLPWPCRS